MAACPDVTLFQKLAAGRLSETDREALLSHLEACDSCARKMERVSEPDTLVGLLRRAPTIDDAGAPPLVDTLVERLSKLRPAEGFAAEAARLPFTSIDKAVYDFLAPPETGDELGRLGGYRVLAVLGAGGMGVVFRAEDPHLKRLVALKAMLPTLAVSKTAYERFLREAWAVAAIKHDHIVSVYQVGEDRGIPFLAMELLEGEPLDVRLEREGKLPVAEVLRIGREVAAGLAAAHEKGLTHRDIKPANIWLESCGARRVESGAQSAERQNQGQSAPRSALHFPRSTRVRILDFGLARPATDQQHLTQPGAIVGTPAYMAPEQAQAKSIGPRCDLFSLGCVLYRMSTGRLPFGGTDVVSTLLAVVTETPRPPRELEPRIPSPLSDLILRLLAKDPADRPPSALAVAETLERIAQDPASQSSPRPGRVWPRRQAALAILALAGVLAALVAATVLFWSTPHGLVKIESDDPAVVFVFDKDSSMIKGADKETIKLRAGEHGVLVKRRDFEFQTEKFSLERGQTVTLKVELLKGKLQVRADGRPILEKNLPAAGGDGAPSAISPATFTNRLGMQFVRISKGKAWLGGHAGKPGDREAEFKEDFYLGKYELTQGEWQSVTGRNPSEYSRTGLGKEFVKDISTDELKRFPVELVSYHEIQLFLEALNKRAKDTGWVYRLPTEAEWEYACRGGPMLDKFESAFDWYFAKPTNTLPFDSKELNFWGHLKRTCQVGSYRPNRLGLYDIHGNVWEWCHDVDNSNPGAPKGVARGGGLWDHSGSGYCRATCRSIQLLSAQNAGIGFRLARVPTGKEVRRIGQLTTGSVWTGKRTYRKGAYAGATVTYELHIHARNGNKFTGHIFDNGPGRNRAEVVGAIDGADLTWREQGRFPELHIMVRGTLSGDTIRVNLTGKHVNGSTFLEGDGELTLNTK